MPLIKVLSYNIRNGQGLDGKIDLSRIAAALSSWDADLICLQEVDVNRTRSFSVHQPDYLAGQLNMHAVFGAAINYDRGAYGNAILSRFPVVKSLNHILPAPDPKRAMLEVIIEIQGKILRLCNTHMELDRYLRLKQMQEFIIPFLLAENTPTLFCGDLNEDPQGAAVRYLNNYLQDSFKMHRGSQQYTFPANQPAERMDYIFYNSACAAVEYQILVSEASDHLPVLTSIDF